MTMVDINQVFSGNTFKGEDLNGDEPIFTIKKVEVKEFGNNGKKVKKLNIFFDGEDKTLICNKINATKIAKAFGGNTDGWIGKKIQLYFDEDVEFGGQTVGGIRVRTGKKPVPPKPVEFDDSVSDIADTF